jgi:CHASE3 domain sensor protein
MFNALKLRNRILGGYSVPIVLSLLVSGFVFITVETVKVKSDRAEASHTTVDDGKPSKLCA